MGFVTDPTYAVFANHEHVYPRTYNNADGLSINAGWNVSTVTEQDGDNTVDPRLAGDIYTSSGSTETFTIDLSSGSAPGPGTYRIDMALGDMLFGPFNEYLQVRDNTTPVITINGTTVAAGQFVHATGVLRTSAANWVANHATVDVVFTSTAVNIVLNPAGQSAFPRIAHFRLTKLVATTADMMGASLM